MWLTVTLIVCRQGTLSRPRAHLPDHGRAAELDLGEADAVGAAARGAARVPGVPAPGPPGTRQSERRRPGVECRYAQCRYAQRLLRLEALPLRLRVV